MEELKAKFGKIYDQYVGKIYRFISIKVSSQEIAEDLSSEVFTRVWDAYRTQQIIENIQAYLYQVARNVVADHYRHHKITTISVEEEIGDIVDPADFAEEKAMQTLEMERIKEALSHLKEDYQNFVILRYIEELSVPEVAQITGKSEESVRVGTHRALQALKERLEARD